MRGRPKACSAWLWHAHTDRHHAKIRDDLHGLIPRVSPVERCSIAVIAVLDEMGG
jgi:hypothetical protein